MGYVPPEIPPTFEKFQENPEKYWTELRSLNRKMIVKDILLGFTLCIWSLGLILFLLATLE